MLLLRQACQPILDSYGLPELHVIIKDKTLTIVGGCGQPLVSIGGIQFSKNTVSEKERTFAVELFEAFMAKHSTKIIDYVAAKRAFVALTVPTLRKEWSMTTYGTPRRIEMPKSNISVSSDSLITTAYFTDADFKAILTTYKADIKEARDYLAAYETHSTAAKILDAQRTTLSSCDI